MRWNGEDHANASAPAGPVRQVGSALGPFDRPDWFDRLAAMHWNGTQRRDARAEASGCSAWLPLAEPCPGELVGLTNWYSFAFRPQFSGNLTPEAKLSALLQLCRKLRESVTQVDLEPVPEVDQSNIMLTTALREAGWWVFAAPVGHSHWLDLAGLDHDTWWAERPGALRNTVARKAKKNLVTIQIVDRFDADLWAAYERIYASSWKPEEGNPALLRDFAEAEGTAGRIRFGIAEIEGERVAAQFWTVENGCAFIHKLAHVEDSIKASPGTLLTAALFRHVIAQDGVQRVDFGTGNDPYKRDWMNRHNRLWRIRAFNPAHAKAWPRALAAFMRSLRQTDEG